MVNLITGQRVNLTHGQTYSPTWNRWQAMIKRTRKTNGPYSKIPVCDRWQSFESFWEDMGDCPEGMSIDRVDNSKGYSPDNCRWATRKQQTDNRSNTVWYGDRIASEVAEQNGISQSTFSMRMKTGWSIEDAVSRPPRRYRPQQASSGASQPQP